MVTYAYVVENSKESISEQKKKIENIPYDTLIIGYYGMSFCKMLSGLVKKQDKIIISDVKVLNYNMTEFLGFLTFFDENELVLISVEDSFNSSKKNCSEQLKLICKINQLNFYTESNEKKIGRPKIGQDKIKKIRYLYFSEKKTIRQISAECDISVGAVHKYIKK